MSRKTRELSEQEQDWRDERDAEAEDGEIPTPGYDELPPTNTLL